MSQLRTKRTTSLQRRLLLLLVPTLLGPWLLAGYLTFESYYRDVGTQVGDAQDAVAASLVNQLNGEVDALVSTFAAASISRPIGHAATLAPDAVTQALSEVKRSHPSFVHAYLQDSQHHIRAEDPTAKDAVLQLLAEAHYTAAAQPGIQISQAIPVEAPGMLFFVARDLPDGWRLIVCFVPQDFLRAAKASLQARPGVLAVLFPLSKDGGPVLLAGAELPEFWQKIAWARGVTADMRSALLGGNRYVTVMREVKNAQSRLFIGQDMSVVFRSANRVLLAAAAALVASLAVVVGLIVVTARNFAGPLARLTAGMQEFGAGHVVPVLVPAGLAEIAAVGAAFDAMSSTVEATQLRLKVVNKVVMELFSCSDNPSILRKAVEVVCTQCNAETAWFSPKSGALSGYQWRNHRCVDFDVEAAALTSSQAVGRQLFHFPLKAQGDDIGTLTVVYTAAPLATVEAMLRAAIGIVDIALEKHATQRFSAQMQTERNLAASIGRSILVENLAKGMDSRVAYHYQAARRLAGDWFYLTEDPHTRALYVMMGDVTGHGLAQGLVTTAVKGALDAIEQLMQRPTANVAFSPAEIISLLATVVARSAKTADILMSCLVARIDFQTGQLLICNAGHTFPIVIKHGELDNQVSHLHKNQQPLFHSGDQETEAPRYTDSSYTLSNSDTLVLYTDGLSEARNLKSEIFGRFLFRSLRHVKVQRSAAAVRDDILAMFKYYTQDATLDDDVCFLVLRMLASDGVQAVAHPAA